MGDYAAIFLGACLVNNLVLDALLGLPPAVAVSKKISAATGMTLAMLPALAVATVITWPLHRYILIPLGLANLQIFCFILVITVGIKAAEAGIKIIRPELHEQIAVFVPLTLINSAALGAALLNLQQQYGVAGSLFYGLGAAAGFGLVVVSMAAMQERISALEVPAPFRGMAIVLITLGIMAMAFMGFNGIVVP